MPENPHAGPQPERDSSEGGLARGSGEPRLAPRPAEAEREDRLLGLALAKGWIRLEEARSGNLQDLVDRAALTEAQLEALAFEWNQLAGEADPEAAEGDAPTLAKSGRSAELRSGSGPGAGATSSIFSATWIERWAQFEDLVLIAEGGMGRIFKGRDTRLRRKVALKLLRREDPELLRRFLQEAELQAKVEHPHVCRVYEAGEWRGQAYIAMQLIQGDTLKAAARGLSFEDKLRLMVQVCEGVQAAHKQGLIHRDLKPTNLMVEKTEEGLKAMVLDFGLARTVQSSGLTRSGMLMGTVHYMSPEQARGEERTLDRRTDVYALGVTLYELFAGEVPFAEAQGLEVLANILSQDPPPLRKVAQVPLDLETVVMKCLEKDPQRRYDSARALGDELQRVLEGEPILARRAPFSERALRWARKNRTLVAVGAVGLLGILALAGWGIRERVQARALSRYAQIFGQEAERIEALVRYAQLQPAHDLRPEQRALKARLEELDRMASEAGGLARGPAASAQGRALWALGQSLEAEGYLQRAWDLGPQTPEVAYALGRARGARLRRDLDEAAVIADPTVRAARVQALQAKAESDVLPLLRLGQRASLEPLSFHEALLAFYERRYDEAESLAARAEEGRPWFFEAGQLMAECELARAKSALDSHEALARLERADRQLRKVQERAPSALSVALGRARVWKVALALGWQWGQSPEGAERSALEACKAAQALDEDGADAQGLLAWVLAARGRAEKDHGKDPSRPLADAIALAKAVHDEAGGREALGALLLAQSTLGSWQLEHGQDPRQALTAAADAARAMIRKDPSSLDDAIQGVKALTWRMLYEDFTGQDPSQTFSEARAMVEQARTRAGALASPHAMAGALYASWAFHTVLHGGDPRGVLEDAIQALNKALSVSPGDFSVHTNLGSAHMVWACYPSLSSEEIRGHLGQAIACYERALSLNPNHGLTLVDLGRAFLLRGEVEGEGSGQDLSVARVHIERSIRRDPSYFEAWLRLGELDLVEAKQRMRRHESPLLLLTDAEAKLRNALKRLPTYGTTLTALAEVECLRGEWAILSGRSPEPSVKKGLEWVQLAISSDAGLPQARRVEAQLWSELWNCSEPSQAEKAVIKGRLALRAAEKSCPAWRGKAWPWKARLGSYRSDD